MIKYFLYICLIFIHAIIVCGDCSFEQDFNKAIIHKDKQYFDKLTTLQWATYRTKKDIPDLGGLLPIENAAFFGNNKLIKWLISNGAKTEDSDVLSYALIPVTHKSKMVSILLTHGVNAEKALNNGQRPLDYLQRLLLMQLNFEDGASPLSERIRSIIAILEEDARLKQLRWSPWRAVWCGAAVRGCKERTRVAAYKSAACPVTDMPDIGKLSDCESELK